MRFQRIGLLLYLIIFCFSWDNFLVAATSDFDFCEMMGLTVHGRCAQDFSEVKTFADAGDADAEISMGQACLDGAYGQPESPVFAFQWFKKAADRGNASAQNELGDMYWQGIGTPINWKEAVRSYKLAAVQNDVNAQFTLGLAYETGHGIDTDSLKAYMWYSIAVSSRPEWASYRDGLAAKMPSDQIERAQEMAARCAGSSFKDCD